MQIKNLIKNLKSSSEFKNWRKTHKQDYLVHIFKMIDKANQDIWQIGYYSKENDKITTFILEKTKVTIVPEAEIFRKEKHEIKALDLKKIKIDFKQAIDKAKELQKKEYKTEKSLKEFTILQHLENFQVWNTTFVTTSFKTLNMKINAETGKIETHDLRSLIDIKS